MLLCLCSKNAPQDVWAALGRSDMPLNAEHVTWVRVRARAWVRDRARLRVRSTPNPIPNQVTASRIAPSLDKPAAVVELAAELCLGEESLLR